MDRAELSLYLESRPEIEWKLEDDKTILLRHSVYDKDNEGIKVELDKLGNITPVKLDAILVNGRNISHITRVTGYMSKVDGWNPGKVGELKDRQRINIT